MGQYGHSKAGFQKDEAPRPALRTINVIFARPRSDLRACSGVMSVVGGPDSENRAHKKVKMVAIPTLCFSKEDKMGTFQPHDDALVVTIRIGGYDVKRVLVD